MSEGEGVSEEHPTLTCCYQALFLQYQGHSEVAEMGKKVKYSGLFMCK